MAKRPQHRNAATRAGEPRRPLSTIPQIAGIPAEHDLTLDSVIERLRWQLDRAETWVANADGKATVVLGMNGALIAAVFAIDPQIVGDFLAQGLLAKVLACALIGAVACSTIQASRTVLPNLGKQETGGSIFHFADVNTMTLDGFSTLSHEMTPILEIRGMEHQVYNVSRIAAHKFQRLRSSVWALIVILIIGVGILLVHHLAI